MFPRKDEMNFGLEEGVLDEIITSQIPRHKQYRNWLLFCGKYLQHALKLFYLSGFKEISKEILDPPVSKCKFTFGQLSSGLLPVNIQPF